MSRMYNILKALSCPYRVGDILITLDTTNPATRYEGTTWEQIQGRFLLAASTSYKAGDTGGETTHKLTINEMPSHTHGWNGYNLGDDISGSGTAYAVFGSDSAGSYINAGKGPQPIGGNAVHNNMPPYLAVYMWKRTK